MTESARTQIDSLLDRIYRRIGELEARLAAFAGQNHAIGCSSGTDALSLALMAWEVGPGDAVFVPILTFAATAEAAALLGATPVFCDVTEDTFAAPVDPRGPQAQELALFGYLTWLQEQAVQTLAASPAWE